MAIEVSRGTWNKFEWCFREFSLGVFLIFYGIIGYLADAYGITIACILSGSVLIVYKLIDRYGPFIEIDSW